MDKQQERSQARLRMRRRRAVKRLVKALFLLAAVGLLGAMVLGIAIPALDRIPKDVQEDAQALSTAKVSRGTLEKTVFGSGTIQPQSQPAVFAQADGTVDKTLVEMGDRVKTGDVLMVLKNDALELERAQLEYALWAAQEAVLDTETYDRYRYVAMRDDRGRKLKDPATGKTLYEQYSNELSIRSPSAGRVMAVYIEEGDDALAVYREHGAVIMLSTDGRMKVELEVENGVHLVLGEKVQVTGSGGVSTEGEVVNLVRQGTRAVIQVNSDAYPMDMAVTVTSASGQKVGEGILEINKPMAVSAYGGVIKGVTTKVGNTVEREQVLARFTWEGMPLYIENASVLLEYAKAKTALEAVEKKLDALVVTAPCDGQIASVDVSADAAVTAGTQLLSIVEEAGMQLVLSVDELDIVNVEVGQKAVMELDALSEVTLSGTVEKIAPLGNTETAVTTYDVYITLDEVDERVKGGMNVSGEIVVQTAEDALLIPMDALSKQNGSYTVTLEDGTVRNVTLGIMTRDNAQVLSGLFEGETVIY